MQVQVNDWKIELLEGMTLQKAQHTCPGDYDAILYKNAEIATFESGNSFDDGKYLGPFFVHFGGYKEFVAETLEVAKAWVDRQ